MMTNTAHDVFGLSLGNRRDLTVCLMENRFARISVIERDPLKEAQVFLSREEVSRFITLLSGVLAELK